MATASGSRTTALWPVAIASGRGTTGPWPVIALGLVIAVGILALAPIVVCQMPPECPMRSGSQGHNCCGDRPVLCHPTSAPAVAPRTVAPAPPPIVCASTSIEVSNPIVLARTSDFEAPAAAIPRFLLAHTFRL